MWFYSRYIQGGNRSSRSTFTFALYKQLRTKNPDDGFAVRNRHNRIKKKKNLYLVLLVTRFRWERHIESVKRGWMLKIPFSSTSQIKSQARFFYPSYLLNAFLNNVATIQRSFKAVLDYSFLCRSFWIIVKFVVLQDKLLTLKKIK